MLLKWIVESFIIVRVELHVSDKISRCIDDVAFEACLAVEMFIWIHVAGPDVIGLF